MDEIGCYSDALWSELPVYLKSSSWKSSRCSVNSCRIYIVLFLLLSGDLETNPGPVDDQMDFFNNINAFSCLPKKGLTIIHLNIRSVRNKIDEVRNIL